MPQIPPLMIQGISFVHLYMYNEGQVLAETLGFYHLNFMYCLKNEQECIIGFKN